MLFSASSLGFRLQSGTVAQASHARVPTSVPSWKGGRGEIVEMCNSVPQAAAPNPFSTVRAQITLNQRFQSLTVFFCPCAYCFIITFAGFAPGLTSQLCSGGLSKLNAQPVARPSPESCPYRLTSFTNSGVVARELFFAQQTSPV